MKIINEALNDQAKKLNEIQIEDDYIAIQNYSVWDIEDLIEEGKLEDGEYPEDFIALYMYTTGSGLDSFGVYYQDRISYFKSLQEALTSIKHFGFQI